MVLAAYAPVPARAAGVAQRSQGQAQADLSDVPRDSRRTRASARLWSIGPAAQGLEGPSEPSGQPRCDFERGRPPCTAREGF